ncbi:hypothetical protein WJ96_20350 [Burkholderia ubonensis]|uniref:Secretin/TonB short N-terminal domain-containing protein n=1 Tax=Burkholderia ubonensis TaxID=101571 RepID=A0AAW3MMU3_9BURK|nr:secretin N-terminal domain-containing protein [Burkholderia ubonensis]KVP89349.1 hypothetical protein WJ96_20350 [Burkholderia ubonensis]
MKRLTTLALVASTLATTGCAVTQHVGDMVRGPVSKASALTKDGKPADAIAVLNRAHQENAGDVEVSVALAKTRSTFVNREVHEANVALERGNDDDALKHLQNAQKSDPRNMIVQQQIARVMRRAQLRETLKQAAQMRATDPDEALARVNGVLAEQPDFREAQALREQLSRNIEKDALSRPRLSASLRKPVSLNFRSQPLQNIFDVISRMSGVNFVFDKDVQLSTPASIFASKTTAEDAINLLLRTNQLGRRVLDSKTLLIYPARPDKDRNYKEFAIRSFYLSQADAKNVMAALRQMIKPKEVYVDERTNAVIVRDTPATLDVAERIVRGLDIPQSEVTLDVQILEVNTNDKIDLGVNPPGAITGTVGFDASKPFTVGDLLHFHGNDVKLDGLKATINFLQQQGKTKLLANPKIRVRNLEKASVSIGERVPVVTTTVNQGVSSESVAYQDVGLTLKVEPRITLDNEVAIKVNLENSDIVGEDKSKMGTPLYTLGTRKAETLMTARDDETQVLAGLIKHTQKESTLGLPFLSQMPILGRAFGSKLDQDNDTELVLLVTPHIERNLALPAASTSTFDSGTEAEVTSEPMTLSNPGDNNAAKDDGPVMTDTIKPVEPSAANAASVTSAANAAGGAASQSAGSGDAHASAPAPASSPLAAPIDAASDGKPAA